MNVCYGFLGRLMDFSIYGHHEWKREMRMVIVESRRDSPDSVSFIALSGFHVRQALTRFGFCILDIRVYVFNLKLQTSNPLFPNFSYHYHDNRYIGSPCTSP